jgi:two-component system chemotaxis response regulator CheB
MNHDTIVIGGSAGALDVLLGLVGALPPDLPASVFVALHLSPEHRSLIPELLSSHGRIEGSYPVHGEEIADGHIYVAPPDNHLELLGDGTMAVTRGPEENGRPAIDLLFRSAAAVYGGRVIAVILSGHLDSGAAGMASVKAHGGIGVVQEPREALAPGMPQNVLDHLAVDYTVTAAELPSLLVRLAALPARPDTAAPRPLPVRLRERSDDVERAMWAAVSALDEDAAVAHRLSRKSAGSLAWRFAERAMTLASQAEALRRVLLEEPARKPKSGTWEAVEPTTRTVRRTR